MGNEKEDTVNLRSLMIAGNDIKICFFYKDEDYRFSGVKIVFNFRKYKKFDILCLELFRKIFGLGFGVRLIIIFIGRIRILNLDALIYEGKYVCFFSRVMVYGLDMNRVGGRDVWYYVRFFSGRRVLNQILREEVDFKEFRFKKFKKLYDMVIVYNKSQLKKITVLKNGDFIYRYVVLLNRRIAQQYE